MEAEPVPLSLQSASYSRPMAWNLHQSYPCRGCTPASARRTWVQCEWQATRCESGPSRYQG